VQPERESDKADALLSVAASQLPGMCVGKVPGMSHPMMGQAGVGRSDVRRTSLGCTGVPRTGSPMQDCGVPVTHSNPAMMAAKMPESRH
jgi:hypothetical protein